MTSKKAEHAAMVEELRPVYRADLADGTERFFEARRETCPWCESSRLRRHVRSNDVVQLKPGRFNLDRCTACGHIFQNPMLNDAGLEFYYRDFYDGLGEQDMNSVFEQNKKGYRSRAEAGKTVMDPETWLDVGTGHGHFPQVAKELFPKTRFDGLDLSDGVKLAEEAGRIDKGYCGDITELSEQLADSYDAVSMFHYLEHTSDPREHLAAALRMLRPGGHLIIEVPDPECRWNRFLGRWWLPWMQPQHLNFVSIGNLRTALAELGATVVVEQRDESRSCDDLPLSLWLALNNATRSGENAPWIPAPSRARKLLRSAAIIAAIPLFALSVVVDRAVMKLFKDRGFSNAYRVVAAKNS
ncbi:class I SAM-dependent methyltransferase [Sciscionella sediminilitoris]|uniref:class I SAM-dependent methyltransferase n=1 Tax=Sciscionella sediminilitoris TaxID=1445613 RepID=UPI0004DF8D7C|nr:class I SAM-dependent methyltransferase [Sciscionella sp. SE31]